MKARRYSIENTRSTIKLNDPESSLNQSYKLLRNHPAIWFDNNSIALTINKHRKTVSRDKEILAKLGLIEENGRYFRFKEKNK